MKKNLFYLGAMAVAAFALSSCAKELEAPIQVESGNVPFEVVASAVDTKTVNDGLSTKWENGDQINLSHAVTGAAAGYTVNGAFTTEGDGHFTGNLAEELVPGTTYDWVAIYPYSASHTDSFGYVEFASSMVQSGYDSKAHLAGVNCPMYGYVAGVPAEETPSMSMKHMGSVVAVNITNGGEEPLTIESLAFSAGNVSLAGAFYYNVATMDCMPTTDVSAKVSVSVENATALAAGESATVYFVVRPFTAPAETVLTIWVNGASKEIALENEFSFVAGKIHPVNYTYVPIPPVVYYAAEAYSTMTGDRVEFDIKDIPAWAKALKDKENTLETIKSAVEALQQQDYLTAYELLGGVPGFVRAYKTFEGTGKAMVRVDYTATDAVETLTGKIKDINTVEDLQAFVKEVEDTYEVSDFKTQVDNAMGTVESYVPDNIKNQIWYGPVKEYVESMTLTTLMDKALESEFVASVLKKVFENTSFRDKLLDSVEKLVKNIEKEYQDKIDSENASAMQIAEELAKNEAIRQAKVAAKQAAEANYTATNDAEVAKLQKTPWGVFKAILNTDLCKNTFEKYELTAVYDALQMLSAEVEALVKYDKGTYVTALVEGTEENPNPERIEVVE